MPDFLRLPITALTLGFDLAAIPRGGLPFHRAPATRRAALVAAWRDSPLKPARNLIRFYESLVALGRSAGTEPVPRPTSPAPFQLRPRRDLPLRDIVVIGSGPGGSVTAALLAEAGRDVTILEEGLTFPDPSCAPFSVLEMEQKYRNRGLTPALGDPPISYAEGRCAGGGSEINSGLYHRTPPEILDRWHTEFGIEACSEEIMRPHFEAAERDLGIALSPPGSVAAASLKLHYGAERLGWKSIEVPRWFRFDPADPASPGVRQSMSRTYLPRALHSGAEFLPGHRAVRLRREEGHWKISGTDPEGKPFTIEAATVFAAAGAIQTPALLLRSGIRRNIGRSLQLHPTLKVIAEFPDEVNTEAMGVPVHQVKEFADRFSFGCSISSLPFLRLAMLDHPSRADHVETAWRRMAIYYAMIVPEGTGTVGLVPGFRDPLVRYRLTDGDFDRLAESLSKLCQLLFAAGASTLYPVLRGFAPLTDPADLSALPTQLSAAQANLMTIHLFSSCPMGERLDHCAADSYGRVHGQTGLHIADASLIPCAPHVNPQGTVMALARRNALHFLGQQDDAKMRKRSTVCASR